MSGPKRAQRHEPMMSATCRAEQHQDQPDDVTHICRWLSHAGPVHNCICGHSWENTFEDRVMAGFAPALMQALQGRTEATECTCGNTYETHQGPEPDCPAHGAVRAFNEAQAENERLHTWAGLLSLLDEHWPEDIFPAELDSETRDPGPRIVSLLRWVERLRAELAEARQQRDQASDACAEHGMRWAGADARARKTEAERDALAAQVAAIRTLITENYGEDYDDEDVPAAVERLMGHLSEYEASVLRLRQSKNEALRQAVAERDALKEAIERARAGLEAAVDAWTPEYDYNLDRARRKGYSQNEVAAEVYGDAIKAVNEALAALAAPETSGSES